MLVADGFRIRVGAHLAVEPASGIQAERFASQRQPPLSEPAFEKRFVEAREIPDLVNAQRVQILFRHFAHTRNLAHVEWREEAGFLPRHHPEHTIGLGLV